MTMDPAMTADAAEEAASREALDWLIALAEAPGDDALRLRFEAWRSRSPLHASAWREASLVGDLIGETRKASAPSMARRRPAPRRFALPAVAMALVACLMLALLPSLRLQWQADYRTGVGEQRDVALADGSVIRLGPDSAVAVGHGEAARSVALIRGEAFFQVARDPARPFTVAAGRVSATVLGTAFDVRRAGDAAVVSVREGLVQVAGDRSAVRLGAGEWLRMAGDGAPVAQGRMSPDLVAAWRQGQLAAKDQSVAEMVDVLRRQYRGVILLGGGDLAEKRITGLYDLSDPAEALAAMVAPQGGTVTRITPWVLVVGD